MQDEERASISSVASGGQGVSYFTDSEDEDEGGVVGPRRRGYSHCRAAVKKQGRAYTERGRYLQILMARGAFEGLPIGKHNDMVTGSWWFVWGSLGSALIPVLPLIDIYVPVFTVAENTALKAFDEMSTWVFLILSGLFFTAGSYAFVRAFEHPPKRALFSSVYHLQTDELLGAWLYLLAVVPAVPFSIVYLKYNATRITYWGSFVCSILIVIGSAGFVYTAYPHSASDSSGSHKEEKKSTALVAPVFRALFGKDSWVIKHVQNDWLASCWFFFWASALVTGGSWFLLLGADNDRQLYVWITGLLDSILFLVGSAYFCSGSYPPPIELAHTDHDLVAASIVNLNEANIADIRPRYAQAAGAALSARKRRRGATSKCVTFDSHVDVRMIPANGTAALADRGYVQLSAVDSPLHQAADNAAYPEEGRRPPEPASPPPALPPLAAAPTLAAAEIVVVAPPVQAPAPALAPAAAPATLDYSPAAAEAAPSASVRRSSLSSLSPDFVRLLEIKQQNDASAYQAKMRPAPAPAPAPASGAAAAASAAAPLLRRSERSQIDQQPGASPWFDDDE